MDTVRAGDEGEYHHSRNLMKNIAVGRRTRKESSNRRGDRKNSRRRIALSGFGGRGLVSRGARGRGW